MVYTGCLYEHAEKERATLYEPIPGVNEESAACSAYVYDFVYLAAEKHRGVKSYIVFEPESAKEFILIEVKYLAHCKIIAQRFIREFGYSTSSLNFLMTDLRIGGKY